jgi:hypothetical protein
MVFHTRTTRDKNQMKQVTMQLRAWYKLLLLICYPSNFTYISEHIFWNKTLLFLCNIQHNSPKVSRSVTRYFFSRRYKFSSLNVLAFSTYNFEFFRSWMQLVQFFIFSFLCHSLCHLPICSLVSLVVFFTSVSNCILFYHSFFWHSM